MNCFQCNPVVQAMRCFVTGLVIVCLLSGSALWAVSGGNVVQGPAGIGLPTGNVQGGTDFHVNLNGGKSIIEWANLNTGMLDSLNFTNGPAVLNRVFQAVDFQGRLNAGGVQVYVVSPNGIHIGPNAVITAGQFVASGLNISNQNFMNGVDLFEPFQVGGGAVAIGQVQNDGTIQVTEKAALLGRKVLNKGAIVSSGGLILLASGERVLLGSEGSHVAVEVAAAGPSFAIDPREGVLSGDAANRGRLESTGGPIVLAAGDTFVQALGGLEGLSLTVDGTMGSARQFGTVRTDSPDGAGGRFVMSAARDVVVEAGSSTTTEGISAGGDITLRGSNVKVSERMASGGKLSIEADNSVVVREDLASRGDLTVTSANRGTYLGGDVSAGGDLTVSAGTFVSLDGDLSSAGKLTVATQSDNTYSLGSLSAADDIDLRTDLYLAGGEWIYDGLSKVTWEGDQQIVSSEGTVKSEGLIHKLTPGELSIQGGGTDAANVSVALLHDGPEPAVSNGGNIRIEGAGDVQLAGHVIATTPGILPDAPVIAGATVVAPATAGGVAIASANGGIYTPGSDAVEVTIEGYSDEVSGGEPIGVDLPDGSGKTAISLISRETLRLGSKARLQARGDYRPATEEAPGEGVDKRPLIDFLAEEAVIGSYVRDPGAASDVAIYLASVAGNVAIDTPDIHVDYPGFHVLPDGGILSSPATVVFDAYDSVILSFLSADTDPYNYRLEVVSRITEWLNEAIANRTLPFADDPDSMKAFYLDYVLRGAGNYPDYPDRRAWVLENRPDRIAAPLAERVIPQASGCPVEMAAAAAELGISADELQISLDSSLAMNPNLNACEACSRLINVSRILNDENGLRMAAMSQIFNTIAPPDALFTPEVQASILTVFAGLDDGAGEPGRQYALAGEYVDAFVEYVAIVETEFKAPVGDAVALVLTKYGSAVMAAENPNISAFIFSQLQSGSADL